jgi:signal transduction histidine kinase
MQKDSILFSPDGLIVLDKAGNILLANNKAKEYLEVDSIDDPKEF